MTKTKKQIELEQQIGELTQDLQRMRADFENYRKRVDAEKNVRFQDGQESMIIKLLPIIDSIDLATTHMPSELAENPWAKGVTSLSKNLQKLLDELELSKIEITPGETEFDPDLHNAISADDSEGDKEIVAEVLQSGYLLKQRPVRHSLVRVSHIKTKK